MITSPLQIKPTQINLTTSCGCILKRDEPVSKKVIIENGKISNRFFCPCEEGGDIDKVFRQCSAVGCKTVMHNDFTSSSGRIAELCQKHSKQKHNQQVKENNKKKCCIIKQDIVLQVKDDTSLKSKSNQVRFIPCDSLNLWIAGQTHLPNREVLI